MDGIYLHVNFSRKLCEWHFLSCCIFIYVISIAFIHKIFIIQPYTITWGHSLFCLKISTCYPMGFCREVLMLAWFQHGNEKRSPKLPKFLLFSFKLLHEFIPKNTSNYLVVPSPVPWISNIFSPIILNFFHPHSAFEESLSCLSSTLRIRFFCVKSVFCWLCGFHLVAAFKISLLPPLSVSL